MQVPDSNAIYPSTFIATHTDETRNAWKTAVYIEKSLATVRTVQRIRVGRLHTALEAEKTRSRNAVHPGRTITAHLVKKQTLATHIYTHALYTWRSSTSKRASRRRHTWRHILVTRGGRWAPSRAWRAPRASISQRERERERRKIKSVCAYIHIRRTNLPPFSRSLLFSHPNQVCIKAKREREVER